MATEEGYKLDYGESYPSNCFPVRSCIYQKEGAGHWLVAHTKKINKQYQKKQSLYLSSERWQKLDKSKNKVCTLDGQLLIKLHCVDRPSDLCSVDISDRNLGSVKSEDFEHFVNVAYVNASDNSLSLGSFSKFCSLRELDLSLNGICNMPFNPVDFAHLEILDLSYNNLANNDIMATGLLPCLKVLHLTGNQLQDLPTNFASDHHDLKLCRSNQNECTWFRVLEVLMLDDNKLSSEVFHKLAPLKKLQHLNLQGNNISEIPYLQHQELNKQESKDRKLDDDSIQSNGHENITKMLKDECHLLLNKATGQISLNSEISLDSDSYEAIFLPLPELHFLNLADNKIFEEEALLAAALFPMLHEIVIHSNPLTTQKSGDPPLLTYFLQERLGIKIRRKKTPDVERPRLMLPTDSKRKVKTTIPKVPKMPVLMEATCSSLLDRNFLMEEQFNACSCHSSLTKETFSTLTNVEEPAENCIPQCNEAVNIAEKSSLIPPRNAEPFFVTQVTELTDFENPLLPGESENNEKMVKTDFPKNLGIFKDCEPLLDVEEDAYSIGIQHSVRMLEGTLKNLLVYRDSKPKLDSLQKPYKEKEKRLKNLEPVQSRKYKGERVQEMLTAIKERETVREIPLSKVLHSNDVSDEDYEKAMALLKDMKKKYKMVHTKAVEQAIRIESETTSEYM